MKPKEYYDELIRSGEWRDVVESIADAICRYRMSGPVRRGSYIDALWRSREDYLREAANVGNEEAI